MKICLICTEIFAWGKYGGFGRATRTIGRELVNRGIEVYAVVPRRNDQKDFEILDGIKVCGFHKYNPFSAIKIFTDIKADLYHSEEPSLLTYLAAKAMPAKIHLVTSRDPRNLSDWMQELRYPSDNIFQVFGNFLFENNFLVSHAVRKADRVFCTANYLEDKVKRKYHLKEKVEFLPTPIEVPQKEIIKSDFPMVCFIARFDRRKRPEMFFKLAQSFPEMKFIAVGMSRNKSYEQYLRKKYSHLKNLDIKGFINQFETETISSILEKSWILVSTAKREGLPNSFLEAMANNCAILSSVNPENVTQKFGYYVKDGNYIRGLRILLESDKWREKGELGRYYVSENYEMHKTISEHIRVYHKLLGDSIVKIRL
jgi:glycosyltransferase involved in cell wall biosynthesis